MNALARVFSYEFIRNGRRRGYLFTTFGLPLLMIVLFYGLQWLSSRGADGAAAPNPTQAAAEVLGSFDFRGVLRAGYVDPAGVYDGAETEAVAAYESVEAAQAALAAGEIDAVYVLGDDYADTGAVQQILPGLQLDKVTSAPLQQLAFSQLAESVDPARLARLRDPFNPNYVDLQRDRAPADAAGEGAVRNATTNFALVYGFGILYLTTIFATSGYLLQSVIEEKENRLIEILISSVRPVQLLAGKVLALGVLGLLQIGTWLAIGLGMLVLQRDQVAALAPFLTTLRVPTEVLPVLTAYFLLGYLLFAAGFGAVGALSNSLQEGPQISVLFVLPALIPWMLIGLFLNSPDGPLAVGLSLFPLTSPLAMIMRAVVTTVPAWQVMLSLGLLALTVVGAFWAAGRLFRVQTLLAGKAPRLRDIPRLIFGKS